MAGASEALFTQPLLLLGGAVIAAPIFRKLGLGTVLGYLAAGVVIGPVLHLIGGSGEILAVAELGVVLLLFIIGLELKPSRLWTMRRDIFGLGTSQVVLTGLALTGLVYAAGLLNWRGALVAGFGLALSSTAFALQLLEDYGDMNSRYGQRSFSILLFQDLAIVPLLAMVSVLGSQGGEAQQSPILEVGIAVGAVIAMILAGRYLLTPMFQIIARTGAREVMIAAALFVVLGSAYLMQVAGLSMAMGAFLAGVMLAESSYRHELEADIEPFRGLLLALFFIAVGLSMELQVIVDNLLLIVIAVPVLMAVKALIIYAICRIAGSTHNDAIRIGMLLPQGGEFGFVLFTTAAAAGLFTGAQSSLLISIVTLSMALTPLTALIGQRLLSRDATEKEEMDEDFEGAGSDVLMIGFSRFGQIAAQILLASGRDVTILDDSPDRIRQAATFGFRIYFGDGTRLDMLRAAGIEKAKIVAVCTHKKEITDKIVDLIRSEYPDVRLFVRSYDRVHSLELRAKDVEYELRETFESGLLFGRRTLEGLGASEDEAYTIGEDIRRRDEERLKLQAQEGILAGRELIHKRPVKPEPLVKPKKAIQAVEEEREVPAA
ncbi:CPA2 family monovalent cation:H+ antiporter-2 [Rhizobium rosettiformans]|uniref:monovalent cation:proton antiporter-2 (CPA2) family protein n=1 Tax=Rhizobium rosettiformans TaxID=1368430 RepID=UPI0028662691|nr:monovalent cation:proton antiporter-2 (CPA2) family protein [Rhizobium rosettiformans]MDR7028773.1 CPA2 family monovalent cation:H+ antiporter-2 [Rhizobium rosettiformans]MDR7063945.1 CPA2 family monovalent cation:H+ antiporter-2 [Rhizobium rosettiformans]